MEYAEESAQSCSTNHPIMLQFCKTQCASHFCDVKWWSAISAICPQVQNCSSIEKENNYEKIAGFFSITRKKIQNQKKNLKNQSFKFSYFDFIILMLSNSPASLSEKSHLRHTASVPSHLNYLEFLTMA